MGSWVTERAQEIKSREADQRSNRDWQIHKAKELELRRDAFWRTLAKHFEGEVDDFNAEMGYSRVLFESNPSRSLVVRRPMYPVATVTVEIDLGGRCLDVTTTTKASDAADVLKHPENRYFLDLDAASGQVIITDGERAITFEQFSKAVLEPVLK